MEPVYYATFAARASEAGKREYSGQERIVLDRIQPFAGIKKLVSKGYAIPVQFVEKARVVAKIWLDSQRACEPGTPYMVSC